jgi:hypothetical protein
VRIPENILTRSESVARDLPYQVNVLATFASRRTHEDVVAAFLQTNGQSFQQTRIGWRIADSNVIDRIDDANSQELSPDDVGQVSSECRVLIRCQPVGQDFAIVGIRNDLRSSWGSCRKLFIYLFQLVGK